MGKAWNPAMKLYQFPISHYCEKARWALQFKNARFQQVNIPPGLHNFIIKRNAPAALDPITVPLLIKGSEVIQGSGEIISYIDRVIPEYPLGFKNKNLQKEALDLEYFLDETVATLFRSLAYNIFLKDRKTLIQFWSTDGPIYTRTWLTLAMPFIGRAIRQMYQTDSIYIEGYKKQFSTALDRLDTLCESKTFLVGDRFSRADLTMAAILAPMVFPKEHPYPSPVPLPDEFQQFCNDHAQRPVLTRIAELYRQYRQSH